MSTEAVVEDEVQAPELEAEQPDTPPEAEAAPEPEEVVITIGDEQPAEEEQAPDWVRDLRKKNREDQRKIRELEAKLQQVQTPQPAVPRLGAKPKLEDFDYDSSKYEAALDNWFSQKRQVEDFQSRVKQAEQQQMQEWQSRLDNYTQAKQKLKVRDFDDAEAAVQEALNQVQQGVLLQGAENPEMIVYALGKNPAKARELGAIKDPVKFAFAIAKLEAQLKVQPRKTPPPPESAVRSTAPISGSVDSNLERLRAEAERTGDMSKVMAYRRQLRAKEAARR